MLNDTQFDFLSDFLKRKSGYSLSKEKSYFLENKIKEIVGKSEIDCVSALINNLQSNENSDLSKQFTEIMTVNETFFFRDVAPFMELETELLPILHKRRKNEKIRIWSAACSTGQEPYSIAMILEESRHKYPGINYEIIANDINGDNVDAAKKGVYTDMQTNRGMPDNYKSKYFTPQNDKWVAKEILKSKISFVKDNLMEINNVTGTFDVIFLRNILIYLDKHDKKIILDGVTEKMNDGGYLVLGAAEGIYAPSGLFKRDEKARSFFVKI